MTVKLFKLLVRYCLFQLAILISLGAQPNSLNPPISPIKIIQPKTKDFNAQKYLFETQYLTTEDGLANLWTSTIYKDNQGFIWIATRYGLNRYDGRNFKLFTKEKNGLYRNDLISRIQQDKEGNLWIYYMKPRALAAIYGEMEAIDIFNPLTGKVKSLEQFLDKPAPFKISDIGFTTINDPQNRVWIPTGNGTLFLYENGEFKKVFEQKGMLFLYLATNDQDKIWLGGKNRLLCINSFGEILETVNLPSNLRGLWLDTNDSLWLSTMDSKNITGRGFGYSIALWSKSENGQLMPFQLTRNGLDIDLITKEQSHIYRTRKDYWYAHSSGYTHIFNNRGELIYSFGENARSSSFRFFEENDNLWFATPTGVVKTKVVTNPFELVQRKAEGLSDCRGITEDEKGNIYFNNIYIYQWNPINRELKKLSANIGTFSLLYRDSLLWTSMYSTTDLGFELNLKTGEEVLYPVSGPTGVNTLLKTNQPYQYLAGQEKGLCYLDIREKKVSPFLQYNDFDTLKNSAINHIYQNSTGIWLATEQGIFLMREGQGIIRQFDSSTGDLPFNHIRHIHEAKNDIFWLATKGGGIIKWQPPINGNPSSKSIQFTTADGLSNDFIYAIYGDDYNRLWFTSDKGLMCMDKTSFQVITFLEENGLPHNEFNFTSHYQAKDGTLYFGGLGGLIAFHPKNFNLQLSNKTPLEVVDYLVLEDNSMEMTNRIDELIKTDQIIIKPTDKFIELHLALLDYAGEVEHHYAFKIEGYIDNWKIINDNVISISSLPFGKYMLKIRGRNENTAWTENELSIPLHIQKPYYFQTWFIASMILLGMMTILGGIRFRFRSLKKEQERLEKEVKKRTQTITKQAEALKALDKTKSRFFANITHELKTPLTLISAPLHDVLKKEQLPKKLNFVLTNVQQNTQKLIKLVEELLDLSKLEHQRLVLEEKKVAFYPLIKRLIAAHSSYALYRSIDLQFNYQADQQLQVLLDVKKFEKIVNNFLSNALKFTPTGGRILLTVKDLGGQLKLEVSDTGIGIPPEDLPYIFNRFFQSKRPEIGTEGGMGIGLALSNEYAKLFGGTLSVESKWEKGATFSFIFPKKEIFSDLITITPPAPLPNTVLTSPNPKKQKKQKILVVEDNKEMSDYIQSILEEQYTVVKADNGYTALSRLKNSLVDLIISDVMMPQMDGFQLLETVKQQEKLLLTPFIMVTARTETPDRLQALKLGVDDYLTKPFLSEELLARVNNLLSNYTARKTFLKEANKVTSFSFESVPSADTLWIQELETIVKNNLQDTHFNVTRLTSLLHISESSLRNKIKSYTGLSPVEYIREARLTKARHFLENHRYSTVSEVVYAIGMKHPANFTKMYKRRFGKLPSEYFQSKM